MSFIGMIRKLLKVLSVKLFIISLIINGLNIYIETSNKLEYKSSTTMQIDNIVVRPANFTRNLAKDKIDDIFDNSFYILEYEEIEPPTTGYCDILIRYVCLDKDLSLENFVWTLTHELVHLNYFTANERFVNFQTFIILYESDFEYFRQIALEYANLEFSGKVEYEYSCAGYVEEYLKARMII